MPRGWREALPGGWQGALLGLPVGNFKVGALLQLLRPNDARRHEKMGVPITLIARFARTMDRIVDGNSVGVGQALCKLAGELDALLTCEFVRQGQLEFAGDLGARMPPGVLGCIPKCLAVLGPFVLSEARQDAR